MEFLIGARVTEVPCQSRSGEICRHTLVRAWVATHDPRLSFIVKDEGPWQLVEATLTEQRCRLIRAIDPRRIARRSVTRISAEPTFDALVVERASCRGRMAHPLVFQ